MLLQAMRGNWLNLRWSAKNLYDRRGNVYENNTEQNGLDLNLSWLHSAPKFCDVVGLKSAV